MLGVRDVGSLRGAGWGMCGLEKRNEALPEEAAQLSSALAEACQLARRTLARTSDLQKMEIRVGLFFFFNGKSPIFKTVAWAKPNSSVG